MENNNPEGLDAIDTLLIMGYHVTREGTGKEATYRLCAKNARINDEYDRELVGNTLREIDNNLEYYTARIVEIGKRLLG
jgi:hypothetical protein